MRLLLIQMPAGGYHTATLTGGHLQPHITSNAQRAYSWKLEERASAERQATHIGGTVVEVDL